MKSIFKYELQSHERQIVDLPTGAKILTVLNQYENCVLYALVDTDIPTWDAVEILMRGTGHTADDCEIEKYISTVSLHEGKLIFHFFIGSGN